MEHPIFISYRRRGGDVAAKLICEALKNRGYSVFFDYDSLKGGAFDCEILSALDQCRDVVLVLPKNALARCRHEDDWVRQEIRYALMKQKNIIPVMLEKFEFPKKLPLDIQEVTRYNGVRFRMDFFDSVIDKIEERLVTSAPARASSDVVMPPAEEMARTVKFRTYLYGGVAGSSDLILYSPESTAKKRVCYDLTEEEWQTFCEAVKGLFAVLFRTETARVAVNRREPLGRKECAPCDGMYFDDAYRYRFDINYLTDSPSPYFDTVHVEVANHQVLLRLFFGGDYIFRTVSADATLSSLGVDETALADAVRRLACFAEHTDQVMMGSGFACRVYEDMSGSYELSYLVNE